MKYGYLRSLISLSDRCQLVEMYGIEGDIFGCAPTGVRRGLTGGTQRGDMLLAQTQGIWGRGLYCLFHHVCHFFRQSIPRVYSHFSVLPLCLPSLLSSVCQPFSTFFVFLSF